MEIKPFSTNQSKKSRTESNNDIRKAAIFRKVQDGRFPDEPVVRAINRRLYALCLILCDCWNKERAELVSSGGCGALPRRWQEQKNPRFLNECTE